MGELEKGLAIRWSRKRIAKTPTLVMGRPYGKSQFISMRMTSNAIRIICAVIILLASASLTGCTAPYATVFLKPFPDTATESEIIEPDDPDIHEALTIIYSDLTKNGYFTETGWSSGGSTGKGWYLEKTYIHKKPFVYVTVYNEGSKETTAVWKAGKRSVKIHVEFQEPDRWFLKVHPDVIRVQNEIAEELTKRFGKEQITTFNGRQAVEF